MTKRLSLFNFLFLTIIFSLSFTALSCGKSKSESKKKPSVQNGVLDLRGWDFESDGEISLDGDWEFYWDELLSPSNFSTGEKHIPQYILFPSIWDIDGLEGKPLPAYGFATYRLTILSDTPSDEHYKEAGIRMTELFTSYKIWINGDEIFTCGKPGTSKENSIPQFIPHVTAFCMEQETEVILQLSNFHYKNGGMHNSIKIGNFKELAREREIGLIFQYILFGGLLIIALYNFSLYLKNKDNSVPLLFAIFCLLIASRVLVTNENYIATLFPHLSWEIRTRIVVLGYYLFLPVFISFTYKLFPKDLHLPVVKLIRIIGAVASGLVIFLPIPIFTQTEKVYQLFIVIVAIYSLIMFIRASFKKRDSAILMVIGIIPLFIATINDILHSQFLPSFSNMHSLVPLGLFAFILIYSYIITTRIALAFTHASIDELCQVNNRRRFFELTEIEIERATRSEKIFSFLIIDIDHFKKINDTYGHLTGDKVLQILSEEFTNDIRKIDIFGRIGGEEFALVLPETNQEEAFLIADRIRQTISSLEMRLTGKKNIHVTISIGISEFNGKTPITREDLVRESDRALYRAKREGRNRVIVHTPEKLPQFTKANKQPLS